jgi:hypothetical protein
VPVNLADLERRARETVSTNGENDGASGDSTGTSGDPAGGGTVLADGGLRTAEDILAALALGAQAVFLGRPVLWALTCGGADGVRDLLTELTGDLAHVMALAGARSLAGLPGVTGPPAGNSLGM